MLANMGPWQWLLILAVVLLIFGAARLPALAKSIGQSARAFKGEMKEMKEEDGQGTASAESSSSPSAKDGTLPNDASPGGSTGEDGSTGRSTP